MSTTTTTVIGALVSFYDVDTNAQLNFRWCRG